VKAANGGTLLMAAAAGKLATVKYAYELDPHLDAVTRTGSTVMHAAVAAANGRSPIEICEVIQFLADQGAKLDERDAAGATPRQIANRVPIAKAAALLSDLIVKSGATPKVAPR
jgi:ankyrin repeat protein